MSVASPLPKLEAHGGEVSAPPADHIERLQHLPCRLTLDLPVTRFTVRDLLKMSVGTILETSCRQSSDIPLRVNGVLVGWTEFEVTGEKLAVRITELA